MSIEQPRRRENPPNITLDEAWRFAIIRNGLEEDRRNKLLTRTALAEPPREGFSIGVRKVAAAILAGTAVLLCTSFSNEASGEQQVVPLTISGESNENK